MSVYMRSIKQSNSRVGCDDPAVVTVMCQHIYAPAKINRRRCVFRRQDGDIGVPGEPVSSGLQPGVLSKASRDQDRPFSQAPANTHRGPFG